MADGAAEMPVARLVRQNKQMTLDHHAAFVGQQRSVGHALANLAAARFSLERDQSAENACRVIDELMTNSVLVNGTYNLFAEFARYISLFRSLGHVLSIDQKTFLSSALGIRWEGELVEG